MLNTVFPSASSIPISWFCFVQPLLCPSLACFFYPVEIPLLAAPYLNQVLSPLKLLGPNRSSGALPRGIMLCSAPQSWSVSVQPCVQSQCCDMWVCTILPHAVLFCEWKLNCAASAGAVVHLSDFSCGDRQSLQFRQAEKAEDLSPCSSVCAQTFHNIQQLRVVIMNRIPLPNRVSVLSWALRNYLSIR